ncbi:hypothetical protein [Phytoactinopolyspora halophila]|uniref:hypothetical protein n=1 Tax=Phytoactinopolyspora halophila TaxID=1981511 RepID=UPI001B8BD354|nr:hypothetical protein [Phytoactinopolyspora halophila]
MTALVPTEFRADAVVLLTTKTGDPVLAVVVEVQLGRDPTKRTSWPAYLATLHARLSCPAVLLVVCADAVIARWCAQPIELGHPGWILRPLVLGPDQVPVVAGSEQAHAVPELVVLSAIAHGDEPQHREVLDAVVQAFDAMDTDHAALYSDVVLGALSGAARRYVEELMATGTYEVKSEFLRRWREQALTEGHSEGRAEGHSEGRAEGRARGEAEAILAILAARDIMVPPGVRTRILECHDLDQLDEWVRRAATAASLGDVFDDA